MIVCPNCRAENMKGSLFCSECGTDLQTPAAITLGLEEDDVDNSPQSGSGERDLYSVNQTSKRDMNFDFIPPPDIAAIPSTKASSRPQAPVRDDMELIVLNTGRRIVCPDRENVILGRSDAVTGEMPDIDLTPDDAVELGVSRRHACITFRDGEIFVTDLGSTNRTFINRQLMMRGQPYPIKNGDEIRLGNAILKVIFHDI
jgi:pSer/pThr/pTyr-binding forkhead associated (FHA) protein